MEIMHVSLLCTYDLYTFFKLCNVTCKLSNLLFINVVMKKKSKNNAKPSGKSPAKRRKIESDSGINIHFYYQYMYYKM